jgi:hypothetical protein
MKYENYISLGNSCPTSDGIKQIKLRKESLPFDCLLTTLNSIYDVLKLLSTDCLDIKDFCNTDLNIEQKEKLKKTYGSWGLSLRNKWGMMFIHHVPNDLDNPNHQYKYKEGETIVDVFTRRFERLKQRFFNERNLLIYQDLQNATQDQFSCIQEQTLHIIKNILDLNDRNELLYITYKENIKKYNVPSKTTIIHPSVNKRISNPESEYPIFVAAVAECIAEYLKNKTR